MHELGNSLRFGVIGMGVGLDHALALDAIEGVVLAGICDNNPQRLLRAGELLPSVEKYAHEEDMMNKADLDALVIASYDDQHAATVIQALDQGLHVFVEKPLARSKGELEQIEVALNRNPSLRLTTNTLLRRSPRFMWLKNCIESGGLGRIYHAELDYLYGRLEKIVHGWRGQDPFYSVTLGGTVHVVDLLIWLTGERPHKVSAIGSGLGLRASPDSRPEGFQGDVVRAALLEFPSNMTAKVSANFGSMLPHFHRVDIYGTTGTFLNVPNLSDETEDIDLSTKSQPYSTGLLFQNRDANHPPKRVSLPYPAVSKGVLIPQFVQAIRGTSDLEICEQEALDVISVCLAIDESVGLGSPVQVKYGHLQPRHGAN